MKLNLAISSLANVLGLINEKNGSNITTSQVTVTSIEASDENPGDNTKITLTGVNGQGIEGSRTFYYGRVNVTSGVFPIPEKVMLAPTDAGAEAVAKFVAAYNLRQEEIYYDGWAFPSPGVPGGVNVWGAPDSLLYNDEIHRIVLEVEE